ncbi:DUF3347 domain-containing protein [Pedobacter duraquae]|uniref:Uncharacterized protein DUF3347 n=1 Tax=Pedobacter duraquae TaxID=425511 RepID=A0A4V6PSF9_9SPHI|nr:DUF3347 domain-containing protein [Pedobacter duraquae]TDO24028.1 uncharacterized protein DUF3347 [Pedobacter duraquae]
MKYYIGMACIMALSACTGAAKKQSVAVDSTAVVATAAAGRNVVLTDPKVQGIYDHYLLLKNALVASNYDAAKTASTSLAQKLSTYEGCENTALIANKIATAKDLVDQRREFTYLSSDVIAMFKHASIEKGVIFVEHCPMANNGDGGDWLAAEKKINNPYYGKEMLECGSVVEELKAVK